MGCFPSINHVLPELPFQPLRKSGPCGAARMEMALPGNCPVKRFSTTNFLEQKGARKENTPYHSTHGEGDYHNVHVQQSVIEEKHKWNLHAEAAGSTNQVFHLMFISCQWAKKKSSNWSKRCEKKNQPKDPRHVPARAELLCVCRWLSHRTPDANSSSALRNQVALIL